MPGLEIILGTESVAAVGGGMAISGATVAGFAPVPRDSGTISGNPRRPQQYNRRPWRAPCSSALLQDPALRGESRRLYNDKNAETRRHTQAVLAPACRRVNVLWPTA